MSKEQLVSPEAIVSQPFVYELTPQEREETQRLMDQFPHLEGGIVPDDAGLLSEVRAASNELPKGLVTALDNFGINSNRWGTLVVRGMPIDTDLPPTPRDGEPVDKPTNYSEYGLLMTLSRTGVPYADVREKKGRLIHQVSPRPGMENAQENGGSSQFFELHTENIFLDEALIPDIFALTCVRPGYNGGAPTLTMSIENALPYLSEEEIALLRDPRYHFHFATSYGQAGRMTEPRSVIHPGNRMTVDFADMSLVSHPGMPLEEVIDQPEAQALLNLKNALIQPDVILSAAWQPGDIVMIDNLKAVHARKGFQALYDGNDRWLQRTFSMDQGDFRATSHLRQLGSHVISRLV